MDLLGQLSKLVTDRVLRTDIETISLPSDITVACEAQHVRDVFPDIESTPIVQEMVNFLLRQSYRRHRWVGVAWRDMGLAAPTTGNQVIRSLPRGFSYMTRLPENDKRVSNHGKIDGFPASRVRGARQMIRQDLAMVIRGKDQDFLFPTRKLINLVHQASLQRPHRGGRIG